jgi:Metallo-beta-lactamase superfamily
VVLHRHGRQLFPHNFVPAPHVGEGRSGPQAAISTKIPRSVERPYELVTIPAWAAMPRNVGVSMRVIAPQFIFLSFLLFGGTANSEIRAQNDFKVTLLGTGTPMLSIDRFGPSTLVEAGNQKLLFDAGRGATIRLHQLGIPIARLDRLFITHFHSDHMVGIPELWLPDFFRPAAHA